MPADQHPSYRAELEHLNYTLDYVEKSLETTGIKQSKAAKEVSRLSRPIADNSQEFIDLMVNSKIMGGLTLKLQNLESAREKPYFARIDFHEDGKKKKESLYIGKMSLSRDEDQSLIIVDWRAPVANMYYESRLGPASYQCPDGEVTGELSLKRQFSILDGQLNEIFDIDITTNDQFLQSYLGASADNRLKDIVSTIQAEQNRVIRAEMGRPLIVQGVAGSGKTTIALHRIAYLIYNYGKSFRPENFVIIAPTRFFLNYISEILPELGVERVKQTTYEDFAAEIIDEPYKIINTYEKLLCFINEQKDNSTPVDLIMEASIFKSGLLLKEMLDSFMKDLELKLLPGKDFRSDDWLVYSAEEIHNLFFVDYQSWPIYQRVEQLKKHFEKRVKDWKDETIAEMENKCRLTIEELKFTKPDTPERQKKIIKLIDEKNERVQKTKQFAKNGIKTYFKQIKFWKALDCYREFFINPGHFKNLSRDKLKPEVVNYLREQILNNLKHGHLEIEDLAAVAYIKYQLYGLSEKIKAKHIVIDEAQDFSIFQFFTLRQIIKDSSFTILGDLAQGIYSYRGTRDWEAVREKVFNGEAEYLTLEQSYRTTVEIMECANQVIANWRAPGRILAKPVIRYGEPVKCISKNSLQEIIADISLHIPEFRAKGIKSIAVIGKTPVECEIITSYLKENGNMEAVLLTGEETEYENSLVVVPSYLVKGLEFDLVFIADANREIYADKELDIKLLYVALTRALHKLIIYYTGELTALLKLPSLK